MCLFMYVGIIHKMAERTSQLAENNWLGPDAQQPWKTEPCHVALRGAYVPHNKDWIKALRETVLYQGSAWKMHSMCTK